MHSKEQDARGFDTQPTSKTGVLGSGVSKLPAGNADDTTAVAGPVDADAPENDALGVHPNTANDTDDNVLVFPSTDEAINRAIARFQDNLTTWRYRDVSHLCDVVRNIRDWARDLWEHFLPDRWKDIKINQPPILLRFEWESPRVLGHYQPGRNDLGFRWEISINPRRLPSRSEIQLADTVLHEELHLFEDLAGIAPKSRNNYHSSWFRRTARNLGIPCTRYGGSLGVRDPSPFMDWARERGLSGQPVMTIEQLESSPTRAPKRVPWVCSCPDGIAVVVQVPRGSELHARCERCGCLFTPR